MRALTCLLLLLACSGAGASPVYTVAEPWLRPARAGAATELYLELRASAPATLVAVRAPVAARVTLVDAYGRAVPSLALPGGAAVRLAPGGPRIRLAALAQGLQRGGHVPLTLLVRAADGGEQEIPVQAEVRHHSPSHDHGIAHAH